MEWISFPITWFLARNDLVKVVLARIAIILILILIVCIPLNPLVVGFLLFALLFAAFIAFINFQEMEARKEARNRIKKFQNIKSALLGKPCPLNTLRSILSSLQNMDLAEQLTERVGI